MIGNAALRHPREWVDLPIAILIGILIFLILSAFTWGLCCFWGLAGLFIVMVIVLLSNSSLRRIAKRVDREDPELYDLTVEATDNLKMALPEVYLSPSAELNAYTRGVFSPIIVLNRGLVTAMDRDETKFVLGHELGHIRLSHIVLKSLLDTPQVRVPILIYLPLLAFKALFLRGRLSRSMEYSADRAGLIACGDLEKAISALIKLGTGRSVSREQIEGAILGQYRIDGDPGFINGLLASHPDLDDRVKEMVRYSKRTGIG